MNALPLQNQKQQLHKHKLGVQGENAASSYLLKKGYQILDRNFRIRGGEVDIIALKENVVVFVEVKTRENTAFGGPIVAVTPKKLHDIRRTAEFYLHIHPNLPYSYRIDVIGLTTTEEGKVRSIDHIENASL